LLHTFTSTGYEAMDTDLKNMLEENVVHFPTYNKEEQDARYYSSV
jgi:hypothetical protein